MTKAINIIATLLLGVCLLFSCGKEPAESQPIDVPDIEVGEFTMTGLRGRVMIACDKLGDQVAALRLYWGEGAYSRDITLTEGTNIMVNNLAEGSYSFMVCALDAQGNLHRGPEYEVRIYGPEYEASLIGRTITSVYLTGATAVINLNAYVPEGMIAHQVEYTSATGTSEFMQIDSRTDKQQIVINDMGRGDVLIRSVYDPSGTGIDLFYTEYQHLTNGQPDPTAPANDVVDGYRGIWFTIGQAASSYGPKYSGGLGTYTMKHIPMLVYAEAVDRTYFVYGGTPSADKKYLQCMIGCYDHRTDKVCKPRVVYDKGVFGVIDPHDDPTVQLDRDGHIWVFVAGRGNSRAGLRFRSVRPYDITEFEYINESIMAYPQVMYSKEKGFFLFFTRYDGTRQLFYQTSADGVTWSDRKQLASIKEGSETRSGHYQISNIWGTKLCTAFNRHINGNVDTRTNVYFLQSTDWGETWTTASGEAVKTPVTERYSNALLRDYQSAGRNCYIKDVNFDSDGNPIILYLTSDNHLTGPAGGVRQWHTLYWTGKEWNESLVTVSTHCYDSGSLWVDKDVWTVLAPTDAGPQYWGTGGEVVMWRSFDRGKSWVRVRSITSNSERNHGYVRRPLYANDKFYAYWADGNPNKMSISYIYMCDSEGHARRLPYNMTNEWETPQEIE